MDAGKLRFGFIGVGRRGLDHLRISSMFNDISIEAVCDVDEVRLSEVSSKYKARAYRNLDDMLEKEKLDVAVISTPTPLHVPQALKCLEYGLDILMEKPIALDMKEVKELLRAIEISDRIVVVGFQFRYSNLIHEIRKTIDMDTLSMIVGYWYWTIPLVSWIARRDMGGGQMVDQAIHLIDLMRFIAGEEVEKVYAIYTEKGRNTVEDRKAGFENWASYVVSLRFKNDVIGCVYSTYALYPGIFVSRDSSIEDRATRESSVLMDIVCREMLIRYRHGIDATIYRRNMEPKILKLEGDPSIAMYRALIEAVRTRDKSILYTSYEDSWKTMAISLAANKSAKTGEVIVLDKFIAET